MTILVSLLTACAQKLPLAGSSEMFLDNFGDP